MQELNLYLFGLANATSDTALWLLDWGRFLTWWPQIFAILSVCFLLLCKNEYGLGWFVKICTSVLFAIGLNQFLSWIYPLITPEGLGVGQQWMRGVGYGKWVGSYPILLFTLSFSCFFWNQKNLFTGWIFSLAIANAWGVLFIGNCFPLQLLMGIGIGLVASGVVVFISRGQAHYHDSKDQTKNGRNNVETVTS
ncbi:MAG: hypothetical protein V7776_09230 [Halopseudomonas aestusnigri]